MFATKSRKTKRNTLTTEIVHRQWPAAPPPRRRATRTPTSWRPVSRVSTPAKCRMVVLRPECARHVAGEEMYSMKVDVMENVGFQREEDEEEGRTEARPSSMLWWVE